MKIVVTGATGNLGTNVLGELSQDEAVESIVGIARRKPDIAMPKVTWHQADVATSPLDDVFEGADAVIHLAWLIQPSHDLRQLEATNIVGTERVFRAACTAKVQTVVSLSSIGAYSPATKSESVDESWPTEGIASSSYSQHKAHVERRIRDFAGRYPDIRFVTLRPGLMFKREAATEIQNYFLGRIVKALLPRRKPIPLVPRIKDLVVQAVYTGDVANAVARVLHADVDGAFNLAADPVLDVHTIADALEVSSIRVPRALARYGVAASWHARLQPIGVGWLDLALQAPLMNCDRAARELSWKPTVSATDALKQLVDGMSYHDDFWTPPLRHPRASSH